MVDDFNQKNLRFFTPAKILTKNTSTNFANLVFFFKKMRIFHVYPFLPTDKNVCEMFSIFGIHLHIPLFP